MLDEDQIRKHYAEAFARPLWDEWRRNYEAFLADTQRLSDEELARPEQQLRLWSARPIASAGSGEHVSLGGAESNPAIVEAVLTLRSRNWPQDPAERARGLQAQFDGIQDLVESGVKRTPKARLFRLFAALLPADMHCALNWDGFRAVSRALLPATAKLQMVESHVLARARLREVLGPEQDLGEHVRRSVFCWYLFKHLDAAHVGKTGDLSAPEDPDPPIVLWSYNKQKKGWLSPSRNVETYRDVVRATVGGASQDDVIAMMASDPNFQTFKKDYLRQLVYDVRKLDLIEVRGGQLFPTEAGDHFLESDEPDALVYRLLERVFPFAHILRMHRQRPYSRKEAKARLQEIYPNWTSTMIPSQLLRWAGNLDLLTQEGDTWVLTESGRYWEARLPAELPAAPPGKSPIESPLDPEDEEEEDEALTSTHRAVEFRGRTLREVLKGFEAAEDLQELVFREEQVAALHHALHCGARKRFAILSGLSGAGKTRLMESYAQIYCQVAGVPVEKHRLTVAVAPDWRDPSGLLGYVNDLREDPVYQAGPVVDLLLQADAHRDRPYFLLLDEMNLARVELYFAPFLSAMETGGRLSFHHHAEADVGIPRSIRWPENLFIIGSVNMDETTHPFSDKVLDRAFTLEFWEADLETFFARRPLRDPEVEALLLDLYRILRPVRRHFGYRTAGEILGFVGTPAAGQNELRPMLIDQGLFSKVLPRIRGEDSPPLAEALNQLQTLFADHKLQQCSDKIASMREMLSRTGVTRFWA